ncbi:MAG TPA: hypothetical protein VLI04_22250, partial [Nocardioidaceae bacterium]|nr:hypothetical protein [Nocardioidaceae bacterium]
MRARLVAVVLLAVVTSLLPGTASGATLTKSDPDDSAGIDLASVVLQSRPRKLIVTLRTYEAFSNAALKPENGALGLAFRID